MPKIPSIRKIEVRRCDLKVFLKPAGKTAGAEVVLAKKIKEGRPKGILKKGTLEKKNDLLFLGVPKGTFYAVARSYLVQDGKKVYSPWSKGKKFTVKSERISKAPKIVSASLWGKTLSVQVALPKGVQGADWVLAEDYYTYRDGKKKLCYQPIEYVQIQKNKTGSRLTFSNLKPGTYYLFGHSYIKGFKKTLSDWSAGRKVVVLP
ncbi:hypothetical protein EVA_07466 [gut metagenome]|uniref:Uncharacterized protein n=1 Tax=gut metagenome TaxID=749906 RepID=J9GC44_9ZZZZ